MFTPQDLKQIADHGLTPERVEEQVENFRRGFPFLKVVRAASPGDGVLVLDGAEVDAAVARYDAAVARGEVRARIGRSHADVQGTLRVCQ